MTTQMTERFNVAGAMLVKLFGDHDREDEAFERHAAGVRDTGIRAAMYGRVFFVALGLVGAVGAAAIYGVGGHLVVVGRDLHAARSSRSPPSSARVYQPLTGLTNARVDLMTSMVSFERVFEVLDAPDSIAERPGAIDLVAPRGSGHVRRTSASATRRRTRRASARWSSTRPAADPDRDVLDDDRPRRRCPGETVALVGRLGRRQVDAGVAGPPALRRHRRGACCIDGHDVRDLTLRVAAGRHRRRRPGPAPVPRVDRRQPALRQARCHGRRARGGLPGGPHPRHDRRPARRLRHGRRRARLPAVGRREAAGGDRPPAAQGSGDGDPRRGDEPSRQRQRAPRAGRARCGAVRAHGDRDRPPPVDDPPRRPHRRASRTGASSSSAPTTSCSARDGRYAAQLRAGRLGARDRRPVAP